MEVMLSCCYLSLSAALSRESSILQQRSWRLQRSGKILLWAGLVSVNATGVGDCCLLVFMLCCNSVRKASTSLSDPVQSKSVGVEDRGVTRVTPMDMDLS